MKTDASTSKFIFSFIFILLLMSPFIVFVFLNSNTTHAGKEYFSEVITSAEHWYNDPGSSLFITITRLAIISVVISFGAIGSLVSVLSRRHQEEVIKYKFSDLIIIQSIGSTFALILMFFFWGNLISGDLFPTISFGYYMTIYNHNALSKLILWSFIAGFSERLVPKIIENIQSKIIQQDKDT